MSRTTQTALALAWWLLSEGIVRWYTSCGYYSRVAFILPRASDCAATIRGQRLFEGYGYLRVTIIRRQRLFEEIQYVYIVQNYAQATFGQNDVMLGQPT